MQGSATSYTPQPSWDPQQPQPQRLQPSKDAAYDIASSIVPEGQPSQEASAAAVIATAAAVDTAAGPGAEGGKTGAGDSSGSGGEGGGRPQPWPVKMLLQAQQMEQLGKQQGRTEGEGEGEGGQLQQLLSLQDGEEEEEERGEEEVGGGEKQAEPQRPQEPGGLMQPLTQALGIPQHQQQQEELREQRQHLRQQQQEQQQQQQQQQQHHERQQTRPKQKRQGQADTRTEDAVDKVLSKGRHARSTISGPVVSEPCRTVAAHPDGTLWSHRTGDVGPLTTRVLQQLLLLPYQGEGAGSGAAAAPPPPGGAVATALATEGDSDSCSDVDAAYRGPPCHVLVAGSYQAYTALRALSYAQGAIRLASYNVAASSPWSSSVESSLQPNRGWGPGAAAATAGSAVCFTAHEVSEQELRLYYGQTVQYGTGRRPELGLPPSLSPSLPPLRPQSKGKDSLSGGFAAAGDVVCPAEAPVAGGGAGLVRAAPRAAGPRQWKAPLAAAAALAEGMGPRRSADGGTDGGVDPSNSVSSQSLLPPPQQQQQQRLKGWPEHTAHLNPRALVSVFLVQPPLGLLYRSGTANAVPAAAGGGGGRRHLPPLAIGATADAHGLGRLLADRLRNHGYCRMQALGRNASSRALAILSVASGALSPTGLGVLAFPYMSALGPQPRADLPPPVAAAAAAVAVASRPAGRRSRDTGRPPPLPGPRATPAATAPGGAAPGTAVSAAVAAGFLDPVLLDKAPQLILEVVLCEWDDSGRPVFLEQATPAMPTAAPGPAVAVAVASASATLGNPPRQESKPCGASCCTAELVPEAPADGATAAAGDPQRPRTAIAAATAAATQRIERSGSSGSSGGGHGPPPVRLAVVPQQRSDATGATAAATASAAATGGGGGTRLELQLGPPDGPDTRTASEAVARAVTEGHPVALAARSLGAVLRLPVVVFRAQGALRKLERPKRGALVFTLQRRSQSQSQSQSEPHQLADKGASRVLRQGSVAAVEARRVYRLPLSALHHHRDSLPEYPPGLDHITAQSVNRRLRPGGTDPGAGRKNENGEGSGGGGDDDDDEAGGDGGGDQRYVQAAAAAAMQHLVRYGTAVLVATSPGSRLTALLAVASVSEGLMRSAGLTVLIRVDPHASPAEPPTTSTNPRQPSASQAPRPLPPRRYQLLLARIDPRVGRLQLLRPDDLVARPAKGSGPG
ncbi:hypothetical protein VOLCADRAFT_96363 [Volvox carteri f. nagariensis]|uniref:Uncharacterized protein n=1 Tax=Volvox carteri f. nagariensis TaxID=3068 RepID=D8U9X4_VOLCA|nr:uncharacterized protein VOLCADRAFT_96363 [Volvox carteri f. nagariensis]EFJ43485.1 hypothetical protein VOLCADRAFT_96363 [Volvox carteri f. nagariensis]|eukprot:XP_002955414.1 hypothetical protein VOLCADRAFT_96363 [Volvox carteri f. nagariensis]